METQDSFVFLALPPLFLHSSFTLPPLFSGESGHRVRRLPSRGDAIAPSGGVLLGHTDRTLSYIGRATVLLAEKRGPLGTVAVGTKPRFEVRAVVVVFVFFRPMYRPID